METDTTTLDQDTVQPLARVSPVAKPLVGKVVLPGSKSVTNRALLLAGLATGTSQLSGMLVSDDTKYMTAALRELGVDIQVLDETTVQVKGSSRLTVPADPLFLGNAGTAMRFLTAAAALVNGEVVLDGDAHMRKRPIGPLVKSLREIGVTVSDANGYPPVRVEGNGKFDADVLEVDGQLSSQYISALMMMAACGNAPLEIRIAGGQIGGRGYIDITHSVMAAFGNRAEQCGDNAWRIAPSGYQSCDYAIEPDASAATYLWAAEVLTGGAIDLGVVPSDMAQPDARSHFLIERFPHLPETIDGSQIQDSIPTLAVLASFNETPVRFTGIENLRVKECDRIEAIHRGLNRIDPGQSEVIGDDLLVRGGSQAVSHAPEAIVDSFDDHRIAMSFALAGLKRDNILIMNPDCVAKTFPEYWNCLRSLGVKVEMVTS